MLHIDSLAAELATAQFADARLKRRLGLLVQKLASNPGISFPKALPSAELEAAYRFFGNPVVTTQGILSGHFEGTRERCLNEKVALVIHDTTNIQYKEDGVRAGLGRLIKNGQAFFLHAALALSDDEVRRPIGVAAFHTWARTDESDEDERSRWRKGVDDADEHLQGTELIHVMDREGDDYVLFSHLASQGHRFVIRAMHNRLLLGQQADGITKLYDAVVAVERVVERDAQLSKRVTAKRSPKQKRIHPARTSRVASLAVGAISVTLKRPRPHPRDSAEKRALTLPESLAVNVVRVWEPEPPEGEEAVEWVLLTSEPIDTVDNILRVVDRYRARWAVEDYFKALKTGCQLEARQLADYESLVNATAVFAPIACHLLALRSEARRTPQAPAQTVITPDQLDVLRTLGRRPLPASPTARDALLAIAELGGYIRYSKSDPGWLTIARGYIELLTLTRAWTAAKLQLARDQG